MDVKSYIKKFRKSLEPDRFKYEPTTKNYRVAGEPMVACRDAIMRSHKYSGIRVSDIFIFDPAYLRYLEKSKYIEEELRSIIQEVIKHQTQGMDAVDRKLALE